MLVLPRDLVIVDELHNLNLATRAGAEISDQLKYFSERLPATFVYASIDVERIARATRRAAGNLSTSSPYGSRSHRRAASPTA